MSATISVAILDDHQPIIDGYRYRLEQGSGLVVVATAVWGAELEPLLAAQPVDVLLLDLQVPTAPGNPDPYPVLDCIPDLLERYPSLSILVISMYAKPVFVRAAMKAGASGYILKDDREALRRLAEVVKSVARDDLYLSPKAEAQLEAPGGEPQLTPRQLEILSLCAAHPNATTGQLAKQLHLSPSTVRNTLSDAYLRLDVRNRNAAILKLRQIGLLPSSTTRL